MSQISTNLARQLVKNFKDLKVNKPYKDTDTKGVWFSRDVLEAALEIEVEGIRPSGLRFYFAAYQEFDSSRPPKHEHKANQTTLVIIPTRDKDIHGNEVRHKPTGEVLHFDLLTKRDDGPAYDKDFREFNDGQICPPPPLTDEGLYEKI